jgi:Amt family ammonium transporter
MCRRAPAISLSGQSIVSEEFLEGLSKRLAEDLSIAARLCFEITETTAIIDLPRAIRFVSRIKSLGSEVALDDFGSGLSFFNHLRHLPVDYFKIEGQFVSEITRQPADCAVAKALTQVGRSLGLQIIAELAEDAFTVRMLRSLDVERTGRRRWRRVANPA